MNGKTIVLMLLSATSLICVAHGKKIDLKRKAIHFTQQKTTQRMLKLSARLDPWFHILKLGFRMEPLQEKTVLVRTTLSLLATMTICILPANKIRHRHALWYITRYAIPGLSLARTLWTWSDYLTIAHPEKILKNDSGYEKHTCNHNQQPQGSSNYGGGQTERYADQYKNSFP